MPQLERRAAMPPLVAQGYSPSEAHQLLVAALRRMELEPDNSTPLERTRKRNAEARTSAPTKPKPTVKPTPKPAAKRAVASPDPLHADRKPSSLLAAAIRSGQLRRKPRPVL
jgi:septum formation inhibitor MinC